MEEEYRGESDFNFGTDLWNFKIDEKDPGTVLVYPNPVPIPIEPDYHDSIPEKTLKVGPYNILPKLSSLHTGDHPLAYWLETMGLKDLPGRDRLLVGRKIFSFLKWTKKNEVGAKKNWKPKRAKIKGHFQALYGLDDWEILRSQILIYLGDKYPDAFNSIPGHLFIVGGGLDRGNQGTTTTQLTERPST